MPHIDQFNPRDGTNVLFSSPSRRNLMSTTPDRLSGSKPTQTMHTRGQPNPCKAMCQLADPPLACCFAALTKRSSAARTCAVPPSHARCAAHSIDCPASPLRPPHERQLPPHTTKRTNIAGHGAVARRRLGQERHAGRPRGHGDRRRRRRHAAHAGANEAGRPDGRRRHKRHDGVRGSGTKTTGDGEGERGSKRELGRRRRE